MDGNHDAILDEMADQLVAIAQRSCFYSADRIPKTTRYFSGQAQANTRMSINEHDLRVQLAPAYEYGALGNPIPGRTLSYQRVSSRIKLGDTVNISNDLYYIRHLEFDFGDLMFHKSAAQWRDDVRLAVRESQS